MLYGKKPLVNPDELDAAEEAEMAALRKTPPAPVPAEAELDADAEGEGEEFSDDFEDDDEGEDGEEGAEPEARHEAPRPREAAAPASAGGAIHVQRQGTAELAGELLLSAASEVLRELRTKKPGGALKITITIEGQRAEGKPPEAKGEGGEQRRRRRRRR